MQAVFSVVANYCLHFEHILVFFFSCNFILRQKQVTEKLAVVLFLPCGSSLCGCVRTAASLLGTSSSHLCE